MELKYYHYVHCPFCVRVRMTLGLLKLPYESIVVPYNDENTPVSLTGKKMLPIMSINGKAMNESLDIMAALDKANTLKVKETESSEAFKSFTGLLNNLGSNVHSLAMPYWIHTPEFDDASRAYFQKKKEEKRGPFKDLVRNRKQFEKPLMDDLNNLISELRPYFRSETFSIYDILLASHIWGLYIVPEFQFPEKVHAYLQNVKALCNFDYHQDYWR